MQRITFDESLDGLPEAFETVSPDREVLVRRAGRDAVVLVPLSDYEAPTETVHLMRSPANSRRLLNAIERLESRQKDGTA